MIAIPNMDKPQSCQECPIFLWCYTANDWKGYEHCTLIDIVRCGECRYFEDGEYCYYWEDTFKSNDFCSYGERRSE